MRRHYDPPMNVAHYLQIALLALIQGAAELLPVSSSAHVILAQKVMGMDPSRPEQVFLLVMLHTGTMFAVLVYFWPRWRRLWIGGNADAGERTSRGQFLKMIILATAVTGVVALRQDADRTRDPRRSVEIPKGRSRRAVQTFAGGGGRPGGGGDFDPGNGGGDRAAVGGRLTGAAGFWIGLVQGFCVPFRGFSRSGAHDLNRPVLRRVAVAVRRFQLRAGRRFNSAGAGLQSL